MAADTIGGDVMSTQGAAVMTCPARHWWTERLNRLGISPQSGITPVGQSGTNTYSVSDDGAVV